MNPYSLPFLKAMGTNTPNTTTSPSVILYNPAEMIQYNSLLALLAQQQYSQQQQERQAFHQRQQELQGVYLSNMTPHMQNMSQQNGGPFNIALTPEMQAIAASQMLGHYDSAYQLPTSINPTFVSAMPATTPKAAPTPTSLPNLQTMLLEQQLMALRSNPSIMTFLPIDQVTVPASMAPVTVATISPIQALQASTSGVPDTNAMLAKHHQHLLEKMKNEASMAKTQTPTTLNSPNSDESKLIVTPRMITIPRSEKVMKLMNYPATVEHLRKRREEMRPNLLRGINTTPEVIDLSSETPVSSPPPSSGTPSTTTSTDSLTPIAFKLETASQRIDACIPSSISDGNNNEVIISDQSKKAQGKLKRKRNDMSTSKSADSSLPIVKVGKEAPESICNNQPTTSQANSGSVTEADDGKKEDDSEVYINVESDPVNGRLRRDQKRTIYSKVKHLLKRGTSLTCNICKKDVLMNHNSVTDHLAGHSGEKQVACVFCGWTTFEKSLMGDHMKKFHPEKKEQRYEDIRDLSKMIEIFSECFPQPGRARHEYSERLELFTQALMEKNIGKIDCGVCGAKLQVNKKLLEKHVMSHPYFRCKICGFMTNDETHQHSHQNDKHEHSSLELGRDYTLCTSSEAMTKVFRKCFMGAFQQIDKTHPSFSLFELSPTTSETADTN